MDFTAALLLATFVLSLVALFLYIWSMSKGMFGQDVNAALTIFNKNEVGVVDDPAATITQLKELQESVTGDVPVSDALIKEEIRARSEADQSSSLVVGICLTLSVIWLLVASVAGLIASIKLHSPDWLAQYGWITFGRIRPIHLNLVAYGWCSLAGIGVSLWLIPRLLKTQLVGAKYAITGGALWTIGVFLGAVSIALGYSDGLEWLEFPWQIDVLLVFGGGLVGLPVLMTLLNRKVDHLYVSVWYIAAGLLWFPVLFLIANIPYLHFGVQQATMNW